MHKKIISDIERKSKILLSSPGVSHGLKRSLRSLLKESAIFRSKLKKSKPQSASKKNNYVQIGGGQHNLKGFINIDLIPSADMMWDVRESIPLKSGSAKFLFSEHFLEHIDYPVSVKKFIKECHRVLDKNGQLVIGVPDSQLAVRAYFLRDKKVINRFIRKWYGKRDFTKHLNTTIDFLNYHFRDQDDHNKYNPHLWAYDYEKLHSLLKDVGFLKIKKWTFDKTIANPKREWGSIYITARK